MKRIVPNRNRATTQRQKMHAIMPLLRPKQNGKWISRDGLAFDRKSDLVDHIAASISVTSRSLWRWYHQFQEAGYAGLGDSPRADKGSSRFFEQHPEAAFFVHRFWGSMWTPHQIWRALRQGMADPPSYRTVRLYVRSLSKGQQ